MNKDLKIIKKRFGEKMMHFCKSQFPTLLDEEGLLSKIISDNFESNKSLYEDLDIYGKTGDFKNHIYTLVEKPNIPHLEEIETPAKLLHDAGYTLYKCSTEEEVQSFKKYYAKGEKLCTFNGDRLNRCYVFFAVKKNVNLINRDNYSEPSRQDEYGTSVISIQFTRDESHTLSIKNRYNHIVVNPDATFSNNLDNIIEGLTDSFEKHYGLEQQYKNKFELNGYVKAVDGKYYKYNYEINNIYYCPNNIIIDNFKVTRLDKEKYILIDYFIIDLQEKKVELYDKSVRDCFAEGFKVKTEAVKNEFDENKSNINKIEIKKIDDNKEITIFNLEKQNSTKITVDKRNKIIGLVINDLVIIKRGFLQCNDSIINLDLPNLEEVEDEFLWKNESLQSINAPNLKKVGDDFLRCNKRLTDIQFFELQSVGACFILFNLSIANLYLPNLEKTGNQFLSNNEGLTRLQLLSLKVAGPNFLRYNQNIILLDLPSLNTVGPGFMYDTKNLRIMNAPNLQFVGEEFLNSNKLLKDEVMQNLNERKRLIK